MYFLNGVYFHAYSSHGCIVLVKCAWRSFLTGNYSIRVWFPKLILVWSIQEPSVEEDRKDNLITVWVTSIRLCRLKIQTYPWNSASFSLNVMFVITVIFSSLGIYLLNPLVEIPLIYKSIFLQKVRPKLNDNKTIQSPNHRAPLNLISKFN